MASNQKLGLQTSIDASPLADRLALIHEAEDLGYTSLWIAEVSGPDAFVSLAALATNTRKAELATGVVPIQIRTPGAMARPPDSSLIVRNPIAIAPGVRI